MEVKFPINQPNNMWPSGIPVLSVLIATFAVVSSRMFHLSKLVVFRFFCYPLVKVPYPVLSSRDIVAFSLRPLPYISLTLKRFSPENEIKSREFSTVEFFWSVEDTRRTGVSLYLINLHTTYQVVWKEVVPTTNPSLINRSSSSSRPGKESPRKKGRPPPELNPPTPTDGSHLESRVYSCLRLCFWRH